MLVKQAADVRSSDITDRALYEDRRTFLRAAGGAIALAATGLVDGRAPFQASTPAPHGRKLQNISKSAFSTNEKPNTWDQITTYNNFYEFGTSYDSASRLARNFTPRPWTVSVDGECHRKGSMNLEDVLKGKTLEERIYRHRCVERWSMVIPWVGFPLADFIRQCEPTSRAKYVEFTTLADPRQMPGVRSSVLQWPYTEGLRMDEAMHPLTLLVVGLYGEVLPNQDGAPLRLAVPWKYGFKHIKSIVRVRFVEKPPLNTWQAYAANEYGFYANVNPTVDHPRWSQAKERRIGEFFMRKTLMFNGYGDQVARLYAGMDLRKYF
jgi:sulfoxide reductase catalytic subunit YedY